MLPRNVYIAYQESYSGGEICDGQENDYWPSHEDTVIDLMLLYATVSRPPERTPNFDIESIDSQLADKDLKTVYAVLVRYYDGDTFGSTRGYHKFVGVFDNRKEAEQKRDAFKGAYNDDNQRRYDGNSWTGYFAGLESCEVEELEVR